jgi:hypothetical protein
MPPQIIIPQKSELYQKLSDAAQNRRLVFMAGIPGVGKSLYVQQLVLLAREAGRTVHLFQYDVIRLPFEDHPLGREKYPEIDGLTQPMIRKAVGIWARQAVWDWANKYKNDDHILIGEVPLIGNRLIELVQKADDQAEELLCSNKTLFMIPVPSQHIREKIVARRTQSINNPQHEKEKKDAQINILRRVWADAHQLAVKLELTPELGFPEAEIPYDPAVYAAVYEFLAQNRLVETLHVDLDLNPSGSVYELGEMTRELRATAHEAGEIIARVEAQYTREQAAAAVEKWYEV